MKKILHLTLHRKWFDLIASGHKKIEYREASPYWMSRIFKKPFPSSDLFDEIHFRNGYGNHRPLVVTEFVCVFVTHSSLCDPQHGEKLDGKVIVIGLGRILRKENYQETQNATN